MLIVLSRILAFIALTTLTQTGGLIYLAVILTPWNRGVKLISFAGLYLLATFAVIPFVAAKTGRVRVSSTFISTLLNRNYVKPEMKMLVNSLEPGIQCLEGNFPFLDGFPLFPHLSHNDGRKLDIAFRYTDSKTGQKISGTPSWFGYGIYEAPRAGEQDTPGLCREKGHWQYSAFQYLAFHGRKTRYTFDPEGTRELILRLAASPAVQKIFIEPHLKGRLNLQSSKIRFHGCRAVRHDDHIHVEVK